ncbi:hypothetical protein [Marinobacterium aestuariivivens]|uniref:Uncharacterized protein n=1 Tax=Marinobacterium aestuariivivens TaxID=1698799 RepID=A0ABW2A575_9GAMM
MNAQVEVEQGPVYKRLANAQERILEVASNASIAHTVAWVFAERQEDNETQTLFIDLMDRFEAMKNELNAVGSELDEVFAKMREQPVSPAD